MRTVSRCSYGADKYILLLMYRSLVRSKIDYGSFIYDGACATTKRRLDVIHNAALRIATGAFRTSPAASVMVEVDEPPLALRRKLLGARYACNVAQDWNNPAYRWIFSETSRARHRAQRALPFSTRMSSILRECNIRPRSIALESFCLPTQAFSIVRSFCLPTQASIFTAELYAILQALYFIQKDRSTKHVVFTDSEQSPGTEHL